VRKSLGEVRLDTGAELLLDAKKDLPVVERTPRQRNNEQERQAPLEEEPAKVDASLDNRAVPLASSRRPSRSRRSRRRR
jgi:hypothetical protein